MDPHPDTPPPGPYYLLPEPAYRHLQDTRDHLHLLARLASPLTQAEDAQTLQLRRALLAQCFQELGDQLEKALVETVWLAV
jgi:hypothetical protein